MKGNEIKTKESERKLKEHDTDGTRSEGGSRLMILIDFLSFLSHPPWGGHSEVLPVERPRKHAAMRWALQMFSRMGAALPLLDV